MSDIHEVPNRHNWIFNSSNLSYKEEGKLDKDSIFTSYCKYLMDVLCSMFEYRNCPETLDPKYLELYLHTYGIACVSEANDKKLYAFYGGWGGTPNAYYEPLDFIIANPYLKLFKTVRLGKDGALIKNSFNISKSFDVVKKTAQLLTEVDVSFNLGIINTRFLSLINATNDRAQSSAKAFLTGLINGELGVIATDDFNQSIITQPVESNTASVNLNSLIELRQYIISSFFNQFGIRSAFNMKRERINEAEVSLSDDSLYPNIDEMLNERKKGVAEINKIYKTEIEVEFSSTWKLLDLERLVKEEHLEEGELPGQVDQDIKENEDVDSSKQEESN